MKKLQLKKEIVQDLDMLKIRGGDNTTTRTITGDSGERIVVHVDILVLHETAFVLHRKTRVQVITVIH